MTGESAILDAGFDGGRQPHTDAKARAYCIAFGMIVYFLLLAVLRHTFAGVFLLALTLFAASPERGPP